MTLLQFFTGSHVRKQADENVKGLHRLTRELEKIEESQKASDALGRMGKPMNGKPYRNGAVKG